MKKIKLRGILAFLISNCFTVSIYSQSISPTNTVGTKPLPCWDCAPANWFDFGGTPDMSNRNQAAATGTTGGGTAWSSAPLPLPPNGHTNWITIRDIGSAGAEESVGTNITGLTQGREYEIVAYTLSSVAPDYSPNYIERFDFQVGAYPRINVTSINHDTQGAWGINRLKFIANQASMQLSFYPGNNAGANSFESVNISVSLNAINTIPFVETKTATTEKNMPVNVNIFLGAGDYDAGQSVIISTLDLDIATPGVQSSINTAEGSWTVNHTTGFLTFTPAMDYIGIAILPYTVQDNFVLDGISSPGTSTPKNITVSIVEEICTEEVLGVDFELTDGETVQFNQPSTNYGFQFDIYSLDNSFNMSINGTSISTGELQFQQSSTPPPGRTVRFADGDIYGVDTPEIYSLSGDAAAPIIRIVISPIGEISMLGSKTSGGPLFPLELYNGNSFNTIVWNSNAPNQIIASQIVTGATHMSGSGYGLNIVPCFCVKPGAAGSPDGYAKVGILTKAVTAINNWPENVPNAYLVLDSENKGMVVSHMNTQQRDDLTAIEGMIIYNTDLDCIQLYRGNTPDVDNARTGWNCIKRSCNE